MEYPILDLKETGKRIKDLREESKLSVEDVTRFLGDISAQSVYKWQRGESLPTVDNLYALSKLFNTPVDDILIGNRERDEGPSLSLCCRFLNYRLNDRTYLRTYTEHITADRGKGGTDDLYHR